MSNFERHPLFIKVRMLRKVSWMIKYELGHVLVSKKSKNVKIISIQESSGQATNLYQLALFLFLGWICISPWYPFILSNALSFFLTWLNTLFFDEMCLTFSFPHLPQSDWIFLLMNLHFCSSFSTWMISHGISLLLCLLMN